jgi:hypothetical protein
MDSGTTKGDKMKYIITATFSGKRMWYAGLDRYKSPCFTKNIESALVYTFKGAADGTAEHLFIGLSEIDSPKVETL